MRPVLKITFDRDRFAATMGVILLAAFGVLSLIAGMTAVSTLGYPWVVGAFMCFLAFFLWVAAAEFECRVRRELEEDEA